MAFTHGDGQSSPPERAEPLCLEEELALALPMLALEGGEGASIPLENGRQLEVRLCLKPKFHWEPLPGPPPLEPGQAQVCSILLEQPGNIAQDWELLSRRERHRASRFRVQRDQLHYICSHANLRRVLGYHLGRDPRSIEFTAAPGGKPRLAGEDIAFNLSHSGVVALLAVTRAAEIGVDIEKVRPIQERDMVAKCFFSPGEVRRYSALPDECREEGFFNCWTRKEAYLKARGCGIVNGLDSFEVSLEPGAPPLLLSVRDEAAEPAQWQFTHLQPCPGYIGAVAVRSRDATLRLWHQAE